MFAAWADLNLAPLFLLRLPVLLVVCRTTWSGGGGGGGGLHRSRDRCFGRLPLLRLLRLGRWGQPGRRFGFTGRRRLLRHRRRLSLIEPHTEVIRA